MSFSDFITGYSEKERVIHPPNVNIPERNHSSLGGTTKGMEIITAK
jgi:hypothetical protein